MSNYLIENAKIWTADKNQPWAECISIKDDIIEFVGNKYEEKPAEDVIRVDAGDKMVVPAFWTAIYTLLLQQKPCGASCWNRENMSLSRKS